MGLLMDTIAIASVSPTSGAGWVHLVNKVALPLLGLPVPSGTAFWLVVSSKGLCLSHIGSLSHGRMSEGTGWYRVFGGKKLSCLHDAVKALTRPSRTLQLSAKTVTGWYQTCFGPGPKKAFVGWALTVSLSVIWPVLCLQAGGQVTQIATRAYKGRLLSVSGTGSGELYWLSFGTY